MTNKLRFDMVALDPTYGYSLVGISIVDGEKVEINEHYDTEAALRARLATGFDTWAAQVDSE